ncbi:hypothetical protein DPMN_114601 [Dreissena polymorpha]|uniref:Uncharacterized protein n=1 Tax=Dreissena polymorpha TaxID=45954 RepID=A0A9D4KKD3_DREPO|nr:hypothetical protein DPMN_114601 [Dreissena polymorpha]
MTKGRRRGGLRTFRSYSTGQLPRTHRRFCQLLVICQSNTALSQRKRSAATSMKLKNGKSAGLTAYKYQQKGFRLM